MLSSLEREVLKCLQDNNGMMTFKDMKFDLAPLASPQVLGRCLSTLYGLKFVDRFSDWHRNEAVSITIAGEDALKI